jgi:hypothetical protein
MRAVFKYPIPLLDNFELDLPVGAQPLSVDVQYGKPQMWALVDTSAPTAPQRFRLAGTGHPLTKDSLEFVGTFLIEEGALVFHVFRVTE